MSRHGVQVDIANPVAALKNLSPVVLTLPHIVVNQHFVRWYYSCKHLKQIQWVG